MTATGRADAAAGVSKCWSVVGDAESLVKFDKRFGCPPVPVTEECHCGRDEEHTDECCVDSNDDREGDAGLGDDDEFAEHEANEDSDDDRGC